MKIENLVMYPVHDKNLNDEVKEFSQKNNINKKLFIYCVLKEFLAAADKDERIKNLHVKYIQDYHLTRKIVGKEDE